MTDYFLDGNLIHVRDSDAGEFLREARRRGHQTERAVHIALSGRDHASVIIPASEFYRFRTMANTDGITIAVLWKHQAPRRTLDVLMDHAAESILGVLDLVTGVVLVLGWTGIIQNPRQSATLTRYSRTITRLEALKSPEAQHPRNRLEVVSLKLARAVLPITTAALAALLCVILTR